MRSTKVNVELGKPITVGTVVSRLLFRKIPRSPLLVRICSKTQIIIINAASGEYNLYKVSKSPFYLTGEL